MFYSFFFVHLFVDLLLFINVFIILSCSTVKVVLLREVA